MSALFLALCGLETLAAVLLYAGLALALLATAFYVRDALAQIRPSSSS
jgi:cardiolipin synthase